MDFSPASLTGRSSRTMPCRIKRFATPTDRKTRTTRLTPARYRGVSAMTEEINVGIYRPFVMVRDTPMPRIGAISAIYRMTPRP